VPKSVAYPKTDPQLLTITPVRLTVGLLPAGEIGSLAYEPNGGQGAVVARIEQSEGYVFWRCGPLPVTTGTGRIRVRTGPNAKVCWET
jgi:hypothetical protein